MVLATGGEGGVYCVMSQSVVQLLHQLYFTDPLLLLCSSRGPAEKSETLTSQFN